MKKLIPLALVIAVLSTVTHAEKVKFILLGDTQHLLNTSYASHYYPSYITAMERVNTDPVTSDAVALLHMGDMIETGRDNNIPLSYDRCKEGLDKLNMPWVPAYGNNDNSGEFNSTFPVSQLSQSPYFLENKNDSRNLAYIFQAGGVDWLVISYQYNGSELTWARGLVEQHFDKNVIIIKHDLNSDYGNGFTQQFLGYDNVKLLLCGHTESVITTHTGFNGQKIGFIKHNWHSANKDTYMAVVELDPDNGTIGGRYYSTYYEKFFDDPSAPHHDPAINWIPWEWSGFEFIGVPEGPNASEYISQNVPTEMMPGETKTVSITMRNTGTDTWSATNAQSLGSQPVNDNTWGMTRVALPQNVATGQEVTFTFDITAPTTIGNYDFEWRMVDDSNPNQGWFGPTTPKISIEVNWPIVNLLQNGSFENGGSTPDHWSVSSSFTRSNEDRTDGGYSLRGNGVGNIGSASQTVSLTQNTNYEISVRIYYPSGSTGTLVFDTTDKFDGAGQGQFVLYGSNGGWQTYSGSFNSGTETSMTVRVFSTDFNGTFYVDSVIVGDPNNRQPPNYPPEFIDMPPAYAEVGSLYSYTVEVEDADGDTVSLGSINNPSWLTFNAGSGLLSGTPSALDIGNNIITIRASDGTVQVDQVSPIYVSAAGNDAPEILSVAEEVAIESQAYSYILDAIDPDGDSLTYAAPTKPNWLSFSAASGVLSGTPTPSDVGTHSVLLTVDDGAITTEQSFNLVVFQVPAGSNIVLNPSFENGGANPSFWSLGNSAVATTERANDGSSSLKVTNASSPTSQALALQTNTQYNISVWIDSSSLTSGVAVFDTSDVFDGAGQGQFAIGSNNGGWTQYSGSFNSGTTTSMTLRIFGEALVGDVYFDNVVVAASSGANVAPVITSNPILEATEGELYSYQVTAVDLEGDTLTYSSSPLPSWLSLDSSSGLLSGTPANGDAGTELITVTVSDGADSDDQGLTLVITSSMDLDADDDKDGVINRLELALGGDPNVPDSGTILPQVSNNGSTIDIDFRREQSTVTYIIQKSTDLVNWTDHITVTDTHGPAGGNATVPVSVSEMSNGKLFLRLKVE